MSKHDPHIEVLNGVTNHGAKDVATCINVDTGPLAMPKHIAIGKMGTDCGGGHDYKIRSYADQVDEYSIWLEAQIKEQNVEVMVALDDIYNKAIGNGVILTTVCMPSPNITHAHAVRRAIMDLASA